MELRKPAVLLFGVILMLASCGRVPGTSGAPNSPAESPTAGATPLTVPGPKFPVGEVALAYPPVTIQAIGGNSPYIWRVSSGTLPGGLDFSTEGVIAGTPTTSGSFTFTVEVTDAGMATANVTEAINIAPRLSAALPHPGNINVREGSAASNGEFASAAGGVAPYTYSMTSGSVPAGTSLNGLSLSGAYSTAGTYRFTVTVTDSLGMTATVTPSFYVWGPIAFPPMWYTPTNTADHRFIYADVECRGTNATGCSAQFAYSGGTPGVTPVISQADSQPAWQGIPGWMPGQDPVLHGLSVTVSGGAVQVSVAPGANPPGWTSGKVFVVLMDPQTHETTRAAEFRITIFP